jgi:hypothetical protein
MSTAERTTPKQPPIVRFTPWTTTLLVTMTIALLIIAAASVMTAINTREICEEQGPTDYLGGSSCSL